MALGRRPLAMSRRGEKQTAKDVGGVQTPGSGNQRFAKGDVKSKGLLIERKDTARDSYIIRHRDLHKITVEALHEDKEPVFVIGFEGRGSFAVIPWTTYLQLKGLR